MTASSSNLSASVRLMIVDDDEALRAVLRQQFEDEGLSYIFEADCCKAAYESLADFAPDMILLDVQMPDGSGFDVCRRLRQKGFDKPILMLTGQDSESDIIKGLEAGANDYIAKPMRMGELLARMKTHLRQHKLSDDAPFDITGLDFVPGLKTISCRKTGVKVILTEKETMVLKLLNKQAPEVVGREQMLSEIWGFQKGLTTHTLETHIYRLRQKLARLTAHPVIVTAQDGYRLAEDNQ
ncbi:MAG: response regulator transcription factor [Candidatus Puniceispirillaceae bacterium]